MVSTGVLIGTLGRDLEGTPPWSRPTCSGMTESAREPPRTAFEQSIGCRQLSS